MSEFFRPEPYVGVSGVAHLGEHWDILGIALEEGLRHSDYFLKMGIQANTTTQLEDREDEHGRQWYPVGDEISRAAANEDSGPAGLGLARPYIHCNFDYGIDNLRHGIEVVEQRTFNYRRGWQFNGLPFVEIDYQRLFEEMRAAHPHHGIVLQADWRNLQDNDPDRVARRVSKLSIDYLLLDPVHDQVRELDPYRAKPYIDAIYQRQLPIGVAIVGGFDAGNVADLFGPLAADFPGLSCDAASGLRSGKAGHSVLDLEKVRDYIRAWKSVTLEAV